MWKHHQKLERHSLLLVIGILVVVAIGGLVEITPLFYLESTIEKVDGIRPYTPLELADRDIYVRMVCTVKRQLFESPLGVIAPHPKASKIWIVQFNQTVQSPGGE